MKLKKMIYTILGSAAMALGAVGTVLPVLPTVPFFLLAGFCFAKSSEKLHRWFVGTALYKKHLADFAAGKGMTKGAKIRIMMGVTLLMSIGFLAMGAAPLGRLLLGVGWLFHLIYFIFGVKTVTVNRKEMQTS